jgi:hypothetical protein
MQACCPLHRLADIARRAHINPTRQLGVNRAGRKWDILLLLRTRLTFKHNLRPLVSPDRGEVRGGFLGTLAQ